MFMLVAMLSLAAAIIPLTKGRAVNVTVLGSSIVWLAISIAVGRGSGAERMDFAERALVDVRTRVQLPPKE